MMEEMKEQFSVRIEAWRMDAETYRSKYGNGNNLLLSLKDKKILKEKPDDLSRVMVEVGMKVYQEEVARDLKNDVLEEIDREI